MTELIHPNDLPIVANNCSEVSEIPPGASDLRHIEGRGTEWYCRGCLKFIAPIWIRVADAVYPACLECFYNDLKDMTKLESAVEEVADVEEIVDVVPEASTAGGVPSLQAD